MPKFKAGDKVIIARYTKIPVYSTTDDYLRIGLVTRVREYAGYYAGDEQYRLEGDTRFTYRGKELELVGNTSTCTTIVG